MTATESFRFNTFVLDSALTKVILEQMTLICIYLWKYTLCFSDLKSYITKPLHSVGKRKSCIQSLECSILLYWIIVWLQHIGKRVKILCNAMSVSDVISVTRCNTMRCSILRDLFGHSEWRGKEWWLVNSSWPSDGIWWHRSGSTLAQVMACCLTAPNHYLDQYWLIISVV